ncbi:phytoene/squalene synthase family protein [Pseudoxanthomonas spadix]|uniref:phytoene/squalene synthase family protein n=1 Tax=Pseudoxanthomonas spadix TaxID=415229 RepID=UPI000EFEAAAD|nr:phytoene/squalene synthase family protein [Pseudoxanthomonas spadix]MBP3975467.1 phytoene/squalene synthase family protein [Pseudoxanthomonas spadix]RMW92742.1 phytoene/squalene synthase family protein [Pseudoxanthomonas spadix]
MSESTALDNFLEKWRSRWPEWQLVQGFVPEPQRRIAVAWFALLQELADAMNIAGDPLPADAKLAWWGEELRDWARHRSRHPLGRVLEPGQAPWTALADALPALSLMRGLPQDTDAALPLVAPLANAIAQVEAGLFPGARRRSALPELSAQLLFTRWMEVPPHADAPRWREALLAHWPARVGGPRPRRVLATLMRLRLQHLHADGQGSTPSKPLKLVWTTWRAAAGGS